MLSLSQKGNDMNDPRYPYTEACDLIRAFGGYDNNGTRLSRSNASQIRQVLAAALGLDDETVARRLADYAREHEQKVSDHVMRELQYALMRF
jgi:hypothetical protein